MEKEFITGDIVINDQGILYIVVYEEPNGTIFAGKIWDGKYPEGTVPCIRLRKNRTPDRRFMSVRTTKEVIGQFKVWFLKTEEIHLVRRIVSEKSKAGYCDIHHPEYRTVHVPDPHCNIKTKTMIKKFRKKPIVIEAIRYDDDSPAILQEIQEFTRIDPLRVDYENEDTYCAVIIPTLEGEMRAMIGDYIIKGVNGEFYPCKPDIFLKTYEEVED